MGISAVAPVGEHIKNGTLRPLAVTTLTRTALHWDHKPFELPKAVYDEWDARAKGQKLEEQWDKKFAAYRAAHPDVPLRVLRNELNQGYDGNQKIGYAYAVAEGFDIVVLLHGDAQYLRV